MARHPSLSERSGKVLVAAPLAIELGVTDVDGRQSVPVDARYGWRGQDRGTAAFYDVGVGFDDTLVREIVRRLLAVVQPDRIILFGSAATGEMTGDSDIDLLIVAAAPENTVEGYGVLHQALRGLGFPFDVFLIETAQFEKTKDVFGGIAYPARKYGRVIYEAA